MTNAVFRAVKSEVRILGVDDAPFTKFKDEKTSLIGVVYRGASYLEGVLSREIFVDGDDSTEQIIRMACETRHRGHLRLIMLSGITFGGLNIADIKSINEATGLPVIIVTRRIPDIEAMKKAISHVQKPDEKIARLQSAGRLRTLEIEGKQIIYQKTGLAKSDAEKIIRLSIVRGLVPEPLRVAHIIASGITTGDSRGRA
ncbi:hypothetical protein BMS3Abin16_00213 [archaeon BMS3Abin16]|nr:hypothetical protein BMS3Abin16_00213 [archaeon BMS3Abin16]GBE56187.1 hypothetical protein BMS3Bbin16_00386 [archaeon BMS3Bbin16]HDY74838.1 DUF99 family protein [Euryarchaeota archaeon]